MTSNTNLTKSPSKNEKITNEEDSNKETKEEEEEEENVQVIVQSVSCENFTV